jgi:MoxR-like ATPase
MWDLREGQTREVQADETPERKEARDRANVVFKRTRDNSSTFDELHALRFRFMARFRRDKAKPFDDVKGIVDEIWIAAAELAQLWERELRKRAVSEDDIKEFTRIIWWHGRKDETMSRLRAALFLRLSARR